VGFAPAAAAATPGPVPAQEIDTDGASARRSWDVRGRPDHLAIVRENRIDVVNQGRLTRQVWHSGGSVTISDLRRALPGDWLTVHDTTAVLDAAIVLVRGTVLQVNGADGGVSTLQMVGGAAPADAAALHTGGGRIELSGITVTSLDPATGQPMPPTAAGRPVLVASGGGHLDLTDVTISDLGTPDTGNDDGEAAVEYHAGADGSVVRTTFQRNTVGLQLSGSHGVHLAEVTVADSTRDGLVLSGDRATTMSGIRATGNGENGVLVTGEPTDRPITGIATTGNTGYGVAAVGQTGLQITGVTTAADHDGGLRLSQATDVTVTDFTATDQRIGVFTHVSSSGILLDGVHTTGGTRGLVVEKSTTDLEARNSTFANARVTGVSVNGGNITLDTVEVSDARSGVRIERGAHDIHLTGLTVAGGEDGVVTAPATTGVVMSNLAITHVTGDGVRTFSPHARITGTRIIGGGTGIDVAAAATITTTEVTAAEEGLHSRSPQQVYASRLTIDTTELGVEAAPGSPLVLVDSQVHALESIRGEIDTRGTNDLSLPPFNLLSAIGVPLILLAIALEEVHSARQRGLGAAPSRRSSCTTPNSSSSTPRRRQEQ
ncbi:MAG: right-handed parallel beta-helix repeat-containing protein, partial [Pseudonocardia sp.]